MFLINKNFSSKLNIDNVYEKNIDEIIIDLLKGEYENRCYQNCYIYKIDELIKRSVVDCDTKRVSVEFSAKVYEIDKYDIIFGNEIQKITNDFVLCKGYNYSCIIKNMKNVFTDKFKLYQKIPIVVAKVNYPMFKPEFTVNGAAFVPILKNSHEIYYKVDKILKEDKDKILEIYKEYLDFELEYMEENKNEKYYKYFIDLLYPFRDKKLKLEFKKDKSNLLEMKAHGIVTRLNIFDLYDHEIMEVKNSKSVSSYLGDISNPIEIDPFSLYSEWVKDYAKHLSYIRQLHEHYGYDDNTFSSNEEVYNLYNDNKI